MPKEDVKELVNEITDHLKKGDSLASTERILNLTKNDIQRYFNNYSDIEYKELQKIGRQYLKEHKQDKDKTKATIKQTKNDNISNEIRELKKRVTALENKATIKHNAHIKHEELNINNLDFKDHFHDSKKSLSNFRLTEANRKKLSIEAKKLRISQNELINYLIWKL